LDADYPNTGVNFHAGSHFGLCDLGAGFPELGYVSPPELASLRGQLGLPVERDRFCVLDQTLQTYADRANTLSRIDV
jgi:Protein of unknown function (DUF2958)